MLHFTVCSFVKCNTHIHAANTFTAFYRTELCFLRLGAHLRDVLLQGVGLSCASLSKPAADYLSALVDTAMVLGVRDTSLGRYPVVALLKFYVYFMCVFSTVVSLIKDMRVTIERFHSWIFMSRLALCQQ